MGYEGNAPMLTIDASGMGGDDVVVLASEVVTENELVGSFRLRWMGHSTNLLPVHVSAEGLKAELERHFSFGEVVVSQTVSSKVVKQWDIAFVHYVGDIAELEIDDTVVEGEGVRAAVLEKVIGNATSGSFALRFWDGCRGFRSRL